MRRARARRVAVVYPWGSADTQPSLGNAATLLARAGYDVDLFVRRDPAFLPPAFDDPAIRTTSFGSETRGRSGRLLRPFNRVLRVASLMTLLGARHVRSPYSAVIGIDPLGLVLADQAARVLHVPLVYFSFELLLDREISSPAERRLKLRERRASQHVRFALVQDEGRAALLTAATGIPLEQCVLVPHAPLAAPPPQRSRRWHEIFALPESERIILYAGSLGAWTGVDEIAASARDWPRGWSLVIHLRSRPPAAELERLRGLADGRVHLSADPVPQEELDDLFAGADVGVAFYVVQTDSVYTQENLRTIGLASGKVSYYLRAGLPVIVNDGTSVAELVRDGGCGVVVSSAAAITDALALLERDYERYTAAARRTFAERLDFEGPFAEVIRRLDALEPTSG